MNFLRTLILSLALFFTLAPLAQAVATDRLYVTTDSALAADSRVARTLRAFQRDGYVEVSRTLNPIYYLVAPSEDYRWGEAQITLRKSSANYSLTTYYAQVRVELMLDIETQRYFVGRITTEESVVH